MKKTVRIVLAILFVLAIMIASTPLNALAKSSDGPTATPNHPLVAGGTWTKGNEVDVTVQAGSAPSWIQLLANGVKVTEAGNICHPFRGGQFGWVGQIMQYQNGQWVKLETTNDWVPNKEGEFMSCAQAPAAGTYALFGYWKRPAGYVEPQGATCNYSTSAWQVDRSNSNEDETMDIDISGLQSDLNGLTLTLSVTNDTDNMLVNDLYTEPISSGSAKYSEVLSFTPGIVEFTVSVSGCSKSFSFD